MSDVVEMTGFGDLSDPEVLRKKHIVWLWFGEPKDFRQAMILIRQLRKELATREYT